MPRPSDKNGIVLSYRIETSTDGTNWTNAAEGTGWNTAVEWKMAQFDAADAKYIRLYGVETSDNSGKVSNEFMSAAEVRVQCAPSEIYAGNTLVELSGDEQETDYTGREIKPEPVVTYKASADAQGIVLRNGTDYKLSYRNNIEPGAATVVVTGMVNYTGVVETGFTIHAAEAEVTGYEEVSVTTAKDEYPALPGTVTAITTIGGQLMEVRWDSISGNALKKTGAFTIYGTVPETNARVAAKVTVCDVIGAEHITVAAAAGAAPALPQQAAI